MQRLYKTIETRVYRTYSGGILLDKFLGKNDPHDCSEPEDWILSFTQAKNPIYVENEGITKLYNGTSNALITDICKPNMLYSDTRTSPGLLIKYLDSSERLGIQVHPTKDFSEKFFKTPYGKTESWHILQTRKINGEVPVIYLGFKEWVTKEIWQELFKKQDVNGMLNAMNCFPINTGDTVLVRGSMPHAIGAGCLILEVQEPTDYTFRAETTNVRGEKLSENQIHYGIGIENMLKCFDYTSKTRDEIYNDCFIKPHITKTEMYTLSNLVTYDDTPCFKYDFVSAKRYTIKCDNTYAFAVVLSETGVISCSNETINVKKSDSVLITRGLDEVNFMDVDAIICYPPQKQKERFEN